MHSAHRALHAYANKHRSQSVEHQVRQLPEKVKDVLRDMVSQEAGNAKTDTRPEKKAAARGRTSQDLAVSTHFRTERCF